VILVGEELDLLLIDVSRIRRHHEDTFGVKCVQRLKHDGCRCEAENAGCVANPVAHVSMLRMADEKCPGHMYSITLGRISTPEQLTDYIHIETRNGQKIIREAGIEVQR